MHITRNTIGRGVRAMIIAAMLVATTLPLTGCSLLGMGDYETAEVVDQPAATASTDSTPTASKSDDTSDTAKGDATTSEESDDSTLAYVGEPQPAAWGTITDLVANGARFLCVDRRTEYRVEHIAGTANVPMETLDEMSSAWSKDSPIVLTSSTERVALSAAAHLCREGFTDVSYLAGGYDEWHGTFEGTDAREATHPAHVYYIYTGDIEDLVNAESYTEDALDENNTIQSGDMAALEDEFGGAIDVEVLDFSSSEDLLRIAELGESYDIPFHWHTGIPVVVTPRWVLVNRDGYVTHVSGFGTVNSNFVYGWCVEQAESQD